jgi:hypothetical protein
VVEILLPAEHSARGSLASKKRRFINGVRQVALEEGEELLRAGAVSQNHLLFPRDAIEVYLKAGDWDRAERSAAELEQYTRSEPLPFADPLRRRTSSTWPAVRPAPAIRTNGLSPGQKQDVLNLLRGL